MKQVLIRSGGVVVEEVPAPTADPGTVVVAVDYSCISVGTELSGVKTRETPLWQRAIREPDKVAKVLRSAVTHGIGPTRNLVEGKLAAAEATGYSAAGRVVEIGEGVTDLQVGDRVACAGAQSAHHAEVIRVPRNLVVPVPDGLDSAQASTVTLGAIALQGVRRAQPTLGETFVVIGLGIIGQLTAQLLRADGCRVIGLDLDGRRVKLARDLGLDIGLDPDGPHDPDHVARLTDGIGADGVIVTAATRSDEVISTAFRMCRKKGRVVLVGDVGLDLDRADFYAKELDFLISSSYGPGRYDRNYEEQGLDYPVAYVRWTENRNMAEYLRLVAQGRVNLMSLLTARYTVTDAPRAYADLKATSGERPIAALLEYPGPPEDRLARRVANPRAHPPRQGAIRVGLIGAGDFAKGMHLPNLQSMTELFQLRAVVSRSGHNAMSTANRFGATYSATDAQQVIDDPEIDLIIVATRHDQHASLALAALRAGKHVLVEKPLALTSGEVDDLRSFFSCDRPSAAAGHRLQPPLFAVRRGGRPPHERSRGADGPDLPNERRPPASRPLDPNGRGWWTQPRRGLPHLRPLHVPDRGPDDLRSRPSRSTENWLLLRRRQLRGHHAIRGRVGGHPGLHGIRVFRARQGANGGLCRRSGHCPRRLSASLRKRREDAAGLDGRRGQGPSDELEQVGRAIRDGGESPIPLWQQLQATEIALAVEPFLTGIA